MVGRTEHIISIFLASPSDVAEERERTEAAVRHVNLSVGKSHGCRIELVSWDTHVTPGFGNDPQDVINEQIGEEYDCLIAIFWHRVGTETPRGVSGSIEEVERALQKFRAAGQQPEVMIYFKNKEVKPSEIDISQLQKLQNFKESLSDKGGLYREFTDAESFEKLVILHLSACISRWANNFPNNSNHTPSRPSNDDNLIEDKEFNQFDDDIGLLDLEEMFSERASDLTSTIHTISNAVERLGDRVAENAQEINIINKMTESSTSRSKSKILINKSAANIDAFSEVLENQIPLFRKFQQDYYDILIQVVEISRSLDGGDDAILTLRNVINSTELSTYEAMQGILGLQEEIVSLPRLTIQLNKAKRRAQSVINELVTEFMSGITLSTELQKQIL